jgi:chorismate-pyruvate lyase
MMERLKNHEVPPPYRELLVHSRDMTPTLEAFYGQPLGLTVLSRETTTDAYFREVVLTAGDRPVEYGAIRVQLEHFPARARRQILAESKPMGTILREESIAHVSWPQAFFRVESDRHMMETLGLAEPCDLYGRRNVLLSGTRRLLAEVIEILAPA